MQNRFAVLASRAQRGFVHHVGQVGPRESRSTARQYGEINIFGERNLAGVYSQNLFAPADIRTAHYYPTVKTAWPQQRRVKHVGAVGGRHQDDAFVRLEAV